ncbi:hypothetical protein MBOURGENBZM_04500 [Methanoculleus bourgensis]|nr:hypothetical protein MBOURGENBZM_04500 [Methanoculleus bourgensis]
MAMEDLDSSVVLHEGGRYPQAVFSLQQAVEKASKSLARALKIIENNEMRKIKHKTPKIFKKSIHEFLESVVLIHAEASLTPETEVLLKSAGMDLEKIAASKDKISTHVEKIFELVSDYDQSKELITGVITNLKLNLGNLEKNRADFEKNGFDETQMNTIRQHVNITVRNLVKKGSRTEVEKASSLLCEEKLLKNTIQLTFKYAECSIALFYLALLTAPHAEKARYPDPNQRFDPLDYYTPDRPIVAALPELHIYTRIALERLDNLYDHIETIANDNKGGLTVPNYDPHVTHLTHMESNP